MNRKSIVTGVLTMLLSVALPAFAILGLGDIVFDPSNYEEAIRQLIQMEKQYEQLIKTYETVRNQYDHMLFMAKRIPVNMAVRYRAPWTPWKYAAAPDTYGTTAAWISAVNSGGSVAAAYRNATEPLLPYGQALSNVPSDQLGRLKKLYGTVELADGANMTGMETIGAMRQNAQANETAIQGLEDDSLSSDPNMNTEIGILNKINAGTVIGLRSTQDTNKLLVALAEQQIIETKKRRDAEARAIAQHVRFMAEEQSLLKADGITDAMLAWKP